MLLRLPVSLLVFCLCNQLLPAGVEVSSWLCLFLLLLLSTFTSCILTHFTWGILRKYTYFVRGIYVCDCYVFLKNWPLLLYNALFMPDNLPCSEVGFIWNSCNFSSCHLISVSMVCLYRSFYIYPTKILHFKAGFLKTMVSSVLFSLCIMTISVF